MTTEPDPQKSEASSESTDTTIAGTASDHTVVHADVTDTTISPETDETEKIIHDNLFQPQAQVEKLTGTKITQTTDANGIVHVTATKTVDTNAAHPAAVTTTHAAAIPHTTNVGVSANNPGFPPELAPRVVTPEYDFELPYFESKFHGGQRLTFATRKAYSPTLWNNNGTTLDAVVAMMLDRIEFINKFPCPENEACLKALTGVQAILGGSSVRLLRPGHRYELPNVENTDALPGNVIQFIEKEKNAAGALVTINDGTTNESVLEATIRFARTQELQDGVTSGLEEALRQLNLRRADRRARGVEGTLQK